jgi:peptide deformylase
MTIIDFLENNAKNYGDEECLVEINPQKKPESYRTWREYNLVVPGLAKEVRRSITRREFDDLAN